MDSTSIEVVQAIDGMYNNAFNNILWIIGAVAGIAIVLMPLLINYIQSRQLIHSEAQIEAKVLSEIKKQYIEVVDNKIAELKKSAKEEHDKLMKYVKFVHEQASGLNYFNSGLVADVDEPVEAFYLYVKAYIDLFSCKDYTNASRCMCNMIDILEERGLQKKDILSAFEDDIVNLEKEFTKMIEIDKEHVFRDQIQSLKSAFRKLE